MTKYLTPNQYLACGDYPPAAGTPPLTLARTIERAETDIDSYMQFDERLGGFEPHTAWVEFPWDGLTRRVRLPQWPVPVRQALQYRIQVSTQTATNAPFVATINTGDVAYNPFEGYIEIVPLQSITYALTPILVQLGLNPPIVQLDYESGFYLPQWGERLLSMDNTTYYAARGYWAMTYTQALSIRPMTLPAIPPVVYVNGVVASPSTYTLDPLEGTVIFTLQGNASPRLSTDVVTLDYCATIPDKVRAAAIDQATFILGQIALNRAGMAGIDSARSGVQQLKRTDASEAGLCQRAKEKLQDFIRIGIG